MYTYIFNTSYNFFAVVQRKIGAQKSLNYDNVINYTIDQSTLFKQLKLVLRNVLFLQLNLQFNVNIIYKKVHLCLSSVDKNLKHAYIINPPSDILQDILIAISTGGGGQVGRSQI